MTEKRRGRPRKFDETVALAAARDVFWRKGYQGASLDDLSKAMGINRPSLFGAFGNKLALYLRALASFVEEMEVAMTQAMLAPVPIAEAILTFYRSAIALYSRDGHSELGCMVFTSAIVEAPESEEIRQFLAATLARIDAAIRSRLVHAREAGELVSDANIEMLADLIVAGLHSLALRSRAGESRDDLNARAQRLAQGIFR